MKRLHAGERDIGQIDVEQVGAGHDTHVTNARVECHLFRSAAKKKQRKQEDKNHEFKVEWTESFELKIKGWTS
ncbi:hypothetical protein CDAR_563511 [Caerostris darwini]|uniref:Uncharacterized protein n=1 Tax=Caerostris darwini TaxID=1538125 RepID=A0AAV4VY91_9ARAC|nr:hypothetical protein CDAR_563511 [Caerostris darwini]